MNNTKPFSEKSLQILVTGLVQGVGFRPFVFRIAAKHNLTGWVQNTNENVKIEVTGKSSDISNFLISLSKDAPPATSIEEISTQAMETKTLSSFSILNSHDVSDEITEISLDIAVRDDCFAILNKLATGWSTLL
ncbi:MAG: acylphosphatase [Bacteroidales bacterium]|nr:acylphosphatase [Bacteroidales bacterium]